MIKYFYEETGMYNDWQQIKRLPDIDTLIDIGLGADGTPELYERFIGKKIVLIDPLDEAQKFYENHMGNRDVIFYKTALGDTSENLEIKVEEEIGGSTIMDVTDINYEGEPLDIRRVNVSKLDDLTINKEFGRLGINIDTEGYELKIIRGSTETLKKTKFVIAEVRHNHESFKGVYKLHEFIREMHANGFVLSMILTAKPFIADLYFERIDELFN